MAEKLYSPDALSADQRLDTLVIHDLTSFQSKTNDQEWSKANDVEDDESPDNDWVNAVDCTQTPALEASANPGSWTHHVLLSDTNSERGDLSRANPESDDASPNGAKRFLKVITRTTAAVLKKLLFLPTPKVSDRLENRRDAADQDQAWTKL